MKNIDFVLDLAARESVSGNLRAEECGENGCEILGLRQVVSLSPAESGARKCVRLCWMYLCGVCGC